MDGLRMAEHENLPLWRDIFSKVQAYVEGHPAMLAAPDTARVMSARSDIMFRLLHSYCKQLIYEDKHFFCYVNKMDPSWPELMMVMSFAAVDIEDFLREMRKQYPNDPYPINAFDPFQPTPPPQAHPHYNQRRDAHRL
jgi:hypothetical protein